MSIRACVGFPCVFTFSPTHHSHTGRATPEAATAKSASGARLIQTGLYWGLSPQLFIFLFGVPTGLFHDYLCINIVLRSVAHYLLHFK